MDTTQNHFNFKNCAQFTETEGGRFFHTIFTSKFTSKSEIFTQRSEIEIHNENRDKMGRFNGHNTKPF